MMARIMGLATVSPRALDELVRANAVVVFDVNSRQSWTKAHVPGAKHVDQNVGEADLPANKSAALVFYCGNPLCRKAPNAARRAQALGYANVRVMSAGINGWLAARLPTESGE